MKGWYRFWEASINDEMCDYIIEQGLKSNIIPGAVRGMGNPRECSISWIAKDEKVKDLIWSYIRDANLATFGFDLTDLDGTQFTIYEKDNHYGWHVDSKFDYLALDRKLSFVLQLSNDEDYEGGEFEFEHYPVPPTFKKRGSVLVFPSFMWHQVKPVISGTRYSLVSWAFGPHWR